MKFSFILNWIDEHVLENIRLFLSNPGNFMYVLECNIIIYLTTANLCLRRVCTNERAFYKPHAIIFLSFCVIIFSLAIICFSPHCPAYMSRRQPDQTIIGNKTNRRFIFSCHPRTSTHTHTHTHTHAHTHPILNPTPLPSANLFDFLTLNDLYILVWRKITMTVASPAPIPSASQLKLSLKSLHDRRSWRLFPVAKVVYWSSLNPRWEEIVQRWLLFVLHCLFRRQSVTITIEPVTSSCLQTKASTTGDIVDFKIFPRPFSGDRLGSFKRDVDLKMQLEVGSVLTMVWSGLLGFMAYQPL